MSTDAVRRIEKWFDGSHEDGDFIRLDREDEFHIIGPTAGSHRIIYCTKRHVAHAAVHDDPDRFTDGLIACGGLPQADDAHWLREFVGKRELIYVGDLDPVGAMIFAWLRVKLSPIEVIYHGISDTFMKALDVVMPESCHIPLNSIEIAAVAEHEQLMPDAEAILGPQCLRLLIQGYKIELEAVRSMVVGSSPILLGSHDYEW